MMQAGTVGIICPACEVVVDIPVSCEIANPEGTLEGFATLECTPDMTDLWAHIWTHDD